MKSNLFISIAGRANVGKSSLLNELVGEKIAIVSDKPQTTRTRINGVVTKGDAQFVFIDTPGFHKAKNKLSQHMLKAIRGSLVDIDVILFMVDVTKKISPIENELIAGFRKNRNVVFLLLNKIDLIKDKTKLLDIIAQYNELYDFKEIIPLSVKKGENLDKLFPMLSRLAIPGEHFFPDDINTDSTEKFWLSEIVREKLLHSLHQEIPHGIAVEIENILETKTNKGKPIVDIGVVIICEKDSHKGMIIGKQGATLKKVGSAARSEMEEYFESKVHMTLWVKVKNDWRNKESVILDLGLSYADND